MKEFLIGLLFLSGLIVVSSIDLDLNLDSNKYNFNYKDCKKYDKNFTQCHQDQSCGWCPLSKKCVPWDNCLNVPQHFWQRCSNKWIQHENAKCQIDKSLVLILILCGSITCCCLSIFLCYYVFRTHHYLTNKYQNFSNMQDIPSKPLYFQAIP